MSKTSSKQMTPEVQVAIQRHVDRCYLKVAPQHAVELGDALPFMVPLSGGDGPDGHELLVPVQVSQTCKAQAITFGADTKVLIGLMSDDWSDEPRFYVPSLGVLKQLRVGVRPMEPFWNGVRLEDLDVLVRKSWTYKDSSDMWRGTQNAVNEHIAQRKNAGAKAAWMRNNVPGLKPNWGIEHTVWPLSLIGGAEFVAQYLNARSQCGNYYDFDHGAYRMGHYGSR